LKRRAKKEGLFQVKKAVFGILKESEVKDYELLI